MFPFQLDHKISEPQRMKSSCLAALMGSSQDTVLQLIAFPKKKAELYSPRLRDKSLSLKNRAMLDERLVAWLLEDLEANRSWGQVEDAAITVWCSNSGFHKKPGVITASAWIHRPLLLSFIAQYRHRGPAGQQQQQQLNSSHSFHWSSNSDRLQLALVRISRGL